MTLANAALIFTEAHVQHPMQAVFDRPVAAYCPVSAGCYGRSIEIVDRSRITLAVFQEIKQLLYSATITAREADNIVAATAEGYPFPANLDIDSPLSGMAPPSQQDTLRQALSENWTQSRLEKEVLAQNGRKRSH